MSKTGAVLIIARITPPIATLVIKPIIRIVKAMLLKTCFPVLFSFFLVVSSFPIMYPPCISREKITIINCYNIAQKFTLFNYN